MSGCDNKACLSGVLVMPLTNIKDRESLFYGSTALLCLYTLVPPVTLMSKHCK